MESQLELEEAEDFQPACRLSLWPQLTGAPPRPPPPSQRPIVPAWLNSRVWPHPGSHFPLGSPSTLARASRGPIKVPVEAAPPGLSEPLFPRWLYGVAGPEGRQRGFSMFGGCLSAK